MIRNLLLLSASLAVLATGALAASPVTINNAANTDSVAVTNHALNVNATVTPSGTQNVNLTQVGSTAVVTGGVAGSQGVGGLAAAEDALAGNPFPEGISDGTNIQLARGLVGLPTTGVGLQAVGLVAAFNIPPTTFTNGQYGPVQMEADGSLRAVITGVNFSPRVNVSGTGVSVQTIGSHSASGFLGTQNFLWNGTTSDAMVDAPGALSRAATTNDGAGSTVVEESGASFTEIAGAASTTVKGTPGILHKVNVGTCASAATIKIYNATSATGTPFTITCGTLASSLPTAIYDVYMSTAIFVVTSGATDVEVSWR